MPIPVADARALLLTDLNDEQQAAVRCESRRLLVVAGAGSGKTEAMARRVAWWVAVDGVPRDEIVAFTFTEAAAEELKFRIRHRLEQVALPQEDLTLGGMYVGTIHGFCLKTLRDFAADDFYMFDVVDDAGRMSLIEQGYNNVLALRAFQSAAARPKFQSLELFLRGYDLLNEYDLMDVALSGDPPPTDVTQDRDWCGQARLRTDVGASPVATAFARSAARYYAYLRARRFLDFSTVQSEVTRRLRSDARFREQVATSWQRLVVDEVQDINPVQYRLIQEIIDERGFLTAVGDHRQAIYSFRGGRVDLMGELRRSLLDAEDGHVQELIGNYRSTPRIIDLSNRWADTIRDRADMENPAMVHRRASRTDLSARHVAHVHFCEREEEADWIGNSILELVQTADGVRSGAFHDERDGIRGLTFSDIAILVRSGTDIRTYQDALRRKGIPAVVRGGPDLFSQPEVLLFLAALGMCAGMTEFWGNDRNPRSMPGRVRNALNVGARVQEIVPAALAELRRRGLNVAPDTDDRMAALCRAVRHRLTSGIPQTEDLAILQCSTGCRRWLRRNRQPRRIFPQTIFHWLLREAGVHSWSADANGAVTESALFHVGQLSTLVKAIETSGWTPADSLQWQLIALLNWGAGAARAAEAPLLASPDAVNITTIHSAKGLEFAAVFLADVRAMRFPSSRARSVVAVPFDDGTPGYVDPARLSDNTHHDNERRLMYVALTRAERHLYVSASGGRRSSFFDAIGRMIEDVGGSTSEGECDIADTLSMHRSAGSRENRLTTSFSDLRYYLECPQDYYLRNVLGFAPTIGQEFGYGRGLHNLLRAIHLDPAHWATLAGDRMRLRDEVQGLVEQGMFYLRYTVGEPLDNLRRRAVEGVVEYIETYADELARLEFEPEREFETVIPEEGLLIGGAIDVVRLDEPPRVSIVDFKSGESEEHNGSGLNRELMALQVGVYGLAAREELEYDPRHGLIRYIGERAPGRRQVEVSLSDARLAEVREEIVAVGRSIRRREFDMGPTDRVEGRCAGCDFRDICPRPEAARSRRAG